MKTKFDNRQLAHVWAQQSQSEGRGSNMFFDGPAIFSYGRHFEIARFITRKGRRAVLFTTCSYSVSTARHIGYVRGALHGLGVPVFHVPDIDAAARGSREDATRDYYQGAVAAEMKRAAGRRSAMLAEMYHARAVALTREANEYAAFFGRRWRIKAPEFTPGNLEALRAAAKKDAAARAARDKAHKAKLARQYREACEEWRRGERASLPYHSSRNTPTMLRLSGDRIETSRGAHIPASAASMVWAAVIACRSQGLAWEPIGDAKPRLGQFTLDHVTAGGDIVAGCHTIEYAELARMAVALGFES